MGDSIVKQIAYRHMVLFDIAIISASLGLFGELSSYVISYWTNVAAAKAFRLRLPSQLKERMAGVSSRHDLATAWQVLLWAEEATGASMPADIRQKLQEEIGHAGT